MIDLLYKLYSLKWIITKSKKLKPFLLIIQEVDNHQENIRKRKNTLTQEVDLDIKNTKKGDLLQKRSFRKKIKEINGHQIKQKVNM